jgi:asparagine synthase (glutamine-hydrolysing)
MCGIVGALTFSSAAFRVTADYLTPLRDAMEHRGPDGARLWISSDGRVGLGHRRLAIIDLSHAADQPMSNEDGSLWVVFNGEIYNHAEIRTELEDLGGHEWKTDHSDTEVILHAFEQWGIECLAKFRGMFAIALWDSNQRELWLIRDRIGVKPLYYSIHDGRLVFASEIKALLEDPDQKRAVNEVAFYHYLSMIAVPSPHTLFEGIQKLPASTWLRIGDRGDLRSSRYWDVWDHTQPLVGSTETEIAERVRDELRTAVQLRKVSDVPVGVFLSGGIDSSTNAALFSENETRPIRTFSIGYDKDYASNPNELPYARQMARRVNAEHQERVLTQDDWFDFLPEMIRLQDEPIADPVCMPVYFVSKLARHHGVIVCQVGEGSDELFLGYPDWLRILRWQRLIDLPLPHSLKRMGLVGLNLCGTSRRNRYELLRRGVQGLPIFWGGAMGFGEEGSQRVLSARLRRSLRGLTSWETLEPIRRRFEENAWEPSNANWMTYLDLSVRLPELLLMRVDKMSMAVSLECRVPFLDHKFVELALSIPSALKTKDGQPKHILKQAVRGLIPDEVIDRRKQGFGVPVEEWFLDRLGPFAQAELTQFCDQADFLDGKEVARLINERQGWGLWYLLNFCLWWKRYVTAQTQLPAPELV